jgi:hypothetical protein
MTATAPPPVVLERLRERAFRQLASPPSGGIHQWLYGCACSLHEAGFHSAEKLVLIKEHCRGLRRPVPEVEIAKAIADAERNCADKWPDASASESSPIIVAPPEPAWPKPDYGRVYTLAKEGIGLYDSWEGAPIRFEDDDNHAEQIADAVFPGNPLLCCGIFSWEFATRRRQVWRGHLHRFQFIVPNPMDRVYGLTAGGKRSEHAKDAVGPRIYLVNEFDISSYATDGVTMTPWAPIIRAWDDNGITVADACAAVLDVLRRILPLVLVLHSGGKSLHAWFNVVGLSEPAVKRFMRAAGSLGADPKTFSKHQFVRMPDGTRDNGNHQVVWFFDPSKAFLP